MSVWSSAPTHGEFEIKVGGEHADVEVDNWDGRKGDQEEAGEETEERDDKA